MTKPIAPDPMFRHRAFDDAFIELCVRWYLSYKLSYRGLVEMMAQRGIRVAHSAILRWVTRYVPEFTKRWDRLRRRVGASWRVDETYISVRGRWHYLYRAVDQFGKTIDILLRRDRGIAAAQAFLRGGGVPFASRLSFPTLLRSNCRPNVLIGRSDFLALFPTEYSRFVLR